MKVHAIVWEFNAKRSAVKRFRKVYGPAGDWARLFRQSPDFISTGLLCDSKDPCRFLTVDLWKSKGAFAAFRKKYKAEYEALDKKCEAMTESEIKMGEFRQF